MPKHRLSLPPADWPAEVHALFEAAAIPSPHQRRRLGHALGRWLLAAREEGLPPGRIEPAVVVRRTEGLSKAAGQTTRQVLRLLWPECDPGAPPPKAVRPAPLEALGVEMERNWHRLPPDWQSALAPLMHIDPDGLGSGTLIEAWAPATLKGRLQRAWLFFDGCGKSDLPRELTRRTLSAHLDARQALWREGELSLRAVLAEVQSLESLARAAFPDGDWSWIAPVIVRLKARARIEPTRNESRVVEITELRALAAQAAASAQALHERTADLTERAKARKRASAALALALLINSPIRVGSLSRLELGRHLDVGLRTLTLAPEETKDRNRDVRLIPPALRAQIETFIALHRAGVAPAGERALFVGLRGRPLDTGYLSQSVGDLTEAHLGTRVTPHVVRNIAASFVCSEAPAEAALAGVILNHRSGARSTETYTRSANQIAAGRRLASASAGRQAELEARQPPAGPGRPGARVRLRRSTA